MKTIDFKIDYIYTVTFFLILAFLLTTVFNYINYLNLDSWSIADWLINYEAGFVRRGLLGEIILIISSKTSLTPAIIVFVLHEIFYFLFFIFSYKILIAQSNYKEYILLVFSPFIFYFQIFDYEAAGRKDIIFITLFTFLIWASLNYAKTKLEDVFYIVLLSFPFVILTHEMFILYLPYILIAYLIKFDLSKKRLAKLILLLLLSFGAFVLSLIFKGDINTTIAVYKSLSELGSNINQNKENAIQALSWTIDGVYKVVINRIHNELYIEKYAFVTLIAFFAFIPIFYKIKIILKNKLSLILFLMSILGTFLLMLIAWDWGRFIYLHLVSFFLLSFLIPSRDNSFLSKININYIWLIAFIYITSWRLPQCCIHRFDLSNIINIFMNIGF